RHGPSAIALWLKSAILYQGSGWYRAQWGFCIAAITDDVLCLVGPCSSPHTLRDGSLSGLILRRAATEASPRMIFRPTILPAGSPNLADLLECNAFHAVSVRHDRWPIAPAVSHSPSMRRSFRAFFRMAVWVCGLDSWPTSAL